MINESNQLYMQAGITTRQISAENPTGEKGGACKWEANPDDPNLRHSGAARKLGQGWKVRPFIPLARGATVTLTDIEGPGCINEIFLTSDIPCYNGLVLRIYWDGELSPSVECPMGAFFALGHDSAPHTVSSAMITVAPVRGMNSYWQMPFRKRALITLTNESGMDAGIVAYRVLYKLHDIPNEAAYFHASYRRSMVAGDYPEHTILDGVKGRGLYVGTYLAYNVFVSGWWGEGEVKFYLDGDEYPSMADNGTEDYFGGAWCFYGDGGKEQIFSSPYLGMPLAKWDNQNGPRKFGLYRWHILDSIGFSTDIKVTVQSLAWYPPGIEPGLYRPAPADIASVAYWYQVEPHEKFPDLLPVEKRCDM
ncbi:MAG: DUF2961 domain-containing protein [Oscillospiraceae bacterium]|nr:DUF2961 domain-containing protein [Oscillospiraceae bacterium]